MEENEYQPGIPDTIPVEQDTILFYGKPLIVVRLPDGHSAVVIRSLCENLELERKAQVRRIQRTEAIADDLIPNVSIETDGGPQKALAKQLHQMTGKAFPTIYDELKTVFEKGRIQDLLEDEWPQVEQWFKVQTEQARKSSKQ